MANENELVTVEVTPAGLIQQALAAGATTETLERLLSLQERWEADQARKAYHEAMAAFKANPPKITKDRLVDFTSQKGRTTYRHATLANVTEKISEALSKHGLSAAWKTDQQGGRVVVICTITHRLGHNESTTLHAEPDNSGNKNSIQQIGSTVTYLQRYTLLALTGLATFDQDDDGQAAERRPITPEKAATILAWVAELNINEGKFLAYLGVDSIEDITEDMLPRVEAVIAKKRREAGK